MPCGHTADVPAPRAETGIDMHGNAVRIAGRSAAAGRQGRKAKQRVDWHYEPVAAGLLDGLAFASAFADDALRSTGSGTIIGAPRSRAPMIVRETVDYRDPVHRELFLSGLRLAAGEAK